MNDKYVSASEFKSLQICSCVQKPFNRNHSGVDFMQNDNKLLMSKSALRKSFHICIARNIKCYFPKLTLSYGNTVYGHNILNMETKFN